MRFILALGLMLVVNNSHAGVNVVYGKDNRKDVYQVRNKLFKELASSTAGMVNLRQLKKSSTPNFFDITPTMTLERALNICTSEAFSQQQTLASCSGFLVSPDTVVTAGHCYKAFDHPENVCKSFAWIFDLHMKSKDHNPTINIPLENVYLCSKVIAAELTPTLDFAVIKLDRPVVGRQPLKYRTSGTVSSSQSLVVIGHPTGLPTKIADGGKVIRNTERTAFTTNLDTFQGNSGSAVFDADTGVIEGILIQGKTDYTPSIKNNARSCQVINKCDEDTTNCIQDQNEGLTQWGEVVLKIQETIPSIKKSIEFRAKK